MVLVSKFGNNLCCKTHSKKTLLTFIILMVLGCFQTSEADQNHASLNTLFDELQNVSTHESAQEIEEQIWSAWLEAPDSNSEILMSQITYAMSLRQHKLALTLCDQLIDSNPDYAEAWNKRATIHYLQGQHALSVADIKQTLLLEPRHFGALSGLGLIFMAASNAEAAVDAYESVVEITPASNNAQANLARAKAMLGDDI